MPATRKKAVRCEPCGKHLHARYTTAVRVALLSSAKRGTALRIYPCPVQRGWHLTKQRRREPDDDHR